MLLFRKGFRYVEKQSSIQIATFLVALLAVLINLCLVFAQVGVSLKVNANKKKIQSLYGQLLTLKQVQQLQLQQTPLITKNLENEVSLAPQVEVCRAELLPCDKK